VNAQLISELVPVAELSAEQRHEMLALMARFYEGVSARMFADDLAEKEWVIRLSHPETGELCGFSTQMVLDQPVGSRRIKALFSGDTIVDERYWGEQGLVREAVRLAASLIDRWPDDELYWFLISAGYKTYRFLPVLFHEFFPCHDRTTPPEQQAVLDVLAGTKYPDRYDAEQGVIRASSEQYHLRAGVAEVTPERERNPHVRYFLKRNPGHTRGEELCCLARLTRANLTPAAQRFLR